MQIIFDDKITDKYTDIPGIYNNDYFIVDASVNTDDDIKQCGSLHLYIDLPEIQNVRIFTKLHLVRFENINSDFYLAFEKLRAFTNIDLKIYRLMGLTFQPQLNEQSSSTAITTLIASTAISTVLLPNNPTRLGFIIVNNSNRDLYLDYDSSASLSDYVQQVPKIASGMTASFREDKFTGVVSGIWASAGSGGAIIKELS
jgi:hypothetical protein